MKQITKIVMIGVLSLGSAVCAAQTATQITVGASYTISDVTPASGASSYQWLENGVKISGATAASYTNSAGKFASGKYEYMRLAYIKDCKEWLASNVFSVYVYGFGGNSFETFVPDANAAAGTTWTLVDTRDNKAYQVIKMPDGKVWMAQNLNYTQDLIANTSSNAPGTSTSTSNGSYAIGSYWCPPRYWVNGAETVPLMSGDESACNVYGALYTWETAMMVDGKYSDEAKGNTAWTESWVSGNYLASGAPSVANADKNNARGTVTAKGGGRGICPVGWHVPTDREWASMLDKVNGNGGGTTYMSQTGTGWVGTDAGKKMKSAGTFTGTDPGDGRWLNDANRGTNASGFGAVPAGHRSYDGAQLYYRGIYVSYWSSAVGSSTHAWCRNFYYSYVQVERYFHNRSYGFSVRCVRD
jgi:uncharacterized protein (TIGR02145 family)